MRVALFAITFQSNKSHNIMAIIAN